MTPSTATQSLPRVAYSIDELAQLLPMSKEAIRKQLQRGSIPSFRIGGRVFVRASELERIMSGEQS